MPLSEQEIKNLLEKAKSYGSRNKKALECLNTIIKNTPPHSYYFSGRAAILCDLGCPIHALDDINRAIELDPDQGGLYLLRGEILLTKVWGMKDKNVFSKEKKQLLEKIVTDYKVAVEKNPSLSLIWFNLIEFNILLHKWDDAISIYGSCRPFIETKEDQLIRAWLGCVALVIAGDPIEEEDKKPLYDQTIKITGGPLGLERIISPSFHREIIEMGASTDGRWEKLVEIHKLYLEHFHDLHALNTRRYALEVLGCYEEALEVCDRAIMLAQNKYILSEILLRKGSILEKLKRNEEALKAYDKEVELQQWPMKLFSKIQLFFKKRAERSNRKISVFRYRTAREYSVKDKEVALANLSRAIELNAEYKDMAKKEDDFKNLWDGEDFKRIVG